MSDRLLTINEGENLPQMKKVTAKFYSELSSYYSNQSGQILIIVLLVLVVGVSIVLSLTARSLTDLRTTTSTEQSNRAYFAAEAGIERALQQIKDGSTGTIVGSNTPLSNQAQYTGQIETTGGSADAFGYDAIKDQTVQVNLKPNINQTDFTQADFGLNSGTLTIYWHTGTDANPRAALEITALRVNSAGNYEVDKVACDPDVSRRSTNGFNCASPVGMGFVYNAVNCDSNIVTSNKGTVDYCYSATFNAVSTAGYKTVLLRIRPLYSNDSMAIRYNSGNLPQQGYKITSTGTGQDGASRKLVVYRSFPALPTVFDFVLYNGSNNALTKP